MDRNTSGIFLKNFLIKIRTRCRVPFDKLIRSAKFILHRGSFLRKINFALLCLWAGFYGLFFLPSCADTSPGYLLEVNGQKLPTEAFVQKFKKSTEYQQSKTISETQVRNFIETNFMNQLLFQAEGFRLKLDKDSSVIRELNQRKREILIRPDGVLYQSIIPEKILVKDTELQEFYDLQKFDIKTEIKYSLTEKIRQVKINQFLQSYTRGLYETYHVTFSETTIPLILNSYRENEDERQLVARGLKQAEFNSNIVTFDGGRWSVQDLMSEYNKKPAEQQPPLQIKEDVIDFARKAIIPDLLYLDALNRSLDLDKKFFTEIERLKKQHVRKACRYLLIDSKIIVSDTELQTYYESEKARFLNSASNFIQDSLRNELRIQRKKELIEEVTHRLRQYYNIRFNSAAVRAVVDRLNNEKLT